MTPAPPYPALTGRRVLVTGGTGAVGQVITAALRAQGATVRLLSRRPLDVAGVEVYRGDVVDPDAVAAAMAGMEIVVHLAALLHVTNPPAALDAEYVRVNDHGTHVVVEAARGAGIERLVYLSTIAVYGPSRPGTPPLDESAPCRPDTTYGRTKLAGERHVLAGLTPDGRPFGVVLRLAAVYGAGIKGNYRRLVDTLARRRYVQIGRADNRRTLVHESDVASAVLLAATHRDANGQIFNVTDGSVHTVSEIVAAINRALGNTWPVVRLPLPVARAAARVIERASRLAGRPPLLAPHMLDKLTEDVAIDGQRLQRVLAFTPAFTLQAGWAETIDRLVERRELATSQARQRVSS